MCSPVSEWKKARLNRHKGNRGKPGLALPLLNMVQPQEGRPEMSFQTVSTATAEHYTWGADCDGWFLLKEENVHVIRERMPRRTAEVMHFHRRSRQLFYVLRGELTMYSDSASVLVRAGQAVVVEPNVRHRASNRSKATLEFLVISSPPSHGDRIDTE